MRGAALRRLRTSIANDLRLALRHLWVDVIIGSPFVPAALRPPLLRLAGVDVRTYGISPKIRFGSARVSVGPRTHMAWDCVFEGSGSVAIGADCLIGIATLFVTSDHRDPGGALSRAVVPSRIAVGDRCWIGARATILPGVTIGDDVVIGAGALVTGDCAPNATYAGVPARCVEPR